MSTDEPENLEESDRPDPRQGVGRIESSPFVGHRFGPKPERTLEVLRLFDIDPGSFSELLEPEVADRGRTPPIFERFITRLQPPPEAISAAKPPSAAHVTDLKPSRLEITEESLASKIQATLHKMTGERPLTGNPTAPTRKSPR